MRQTRWIFAGVLTLVAAVALLVASLGRANLVVDPADSPAASNGGASAAIATGSLETATPRIDPTAQTTPAAPTPSSASPTAPPRASGPPLLAWAEFLAHLNEDRATVEGLNVALTTAAQAQDPAAVKTASVDILDFVDVERDWLREHPPADCYAAAHGAAAAMLDAYGTAADRFIDWSDSGGGLGGLPALGVALDTADKARAAFEAFVAALEGTTCPT